MTKKEKHTYISIGVFFVILVFIGTSEKAAIDNVTYESVAKEFVAPPSLPALTGDPVLTLAELPELESLPEITGIVSPTADDLPHLTLPPLEG
jgi:hypothetical protein